MEQRNEQKQTNNIFRYALGHSVRITNNNRLTRVLPTNTFQYPMFETILSLDVPLPPGLSPSTATALVQQQHRLLAPRDTKALKIKGAKFKSGTHASRLQLLVVVLYTMLMAMTEAVFTPTDKTTLVSAVTACLDESTNGSCPIFAATIWGGSDAYGTIDAWNVSKMTDLSTLFENKYDFIGNLSEWKVENCVNMRHMFKNAHDFVGDLSKWNVGRVTDMGYVFHEARSFNSDLSKWNVEKVIKMTSLFGDFDGSGNNNFNSDLSKWKTGQVTQMNHLFYKAKFFNSDLSKWNVGKVTRMDGMFSSAESFTSDLSKWKVENVTTFWGTFHRAFLFNSDLSAWNVGNAEATNGMFNLAYAFTSDLSSWNVGKVTQMKNMFTAIPTDDLRDSGTHYYEHKLCGEHWVNSAAANKDTVPQITDYICAPCNSILPEHVDEFCANNGNNNLTMHKKYSMCETSNCVNTIDARDIDAPKCCACGYDNGTTPNPGSCACGIVGTPNICTHSNMHCNAASKVCANFSIPTCEHSNGLIENPSSCACGSNACEHSSTTGLYCTKTKSDCRKYPLCLHGEGVKPNPFNCSCGSTDCTDGINTFCYEPLSQCKPNRTNFVSGDDPSTVIGRKAQLASVFTLLVWCVYQFYSQLLLSLSLLSSCL